jgi:DNA-directed RNA polymerase specialized sigma24 family protein
MWLMSGNWWATISQSWLALLGVLRYGGQRGPETRGEVSATPIPRNERSASDEHPKEPSDEQKHGMSDLELIRIADKDGEAFRILVSIRLNHIRLMIKEWCDEVETAAGANSEITHDTVRVAVEYARYIPDQVLAFEPPDWFTQIAQLVFHSWLEKKRRGDLFPEDLPPIKLSPGERLRRRKEGNLVRKQFDGLEMPGHREILEHVMIGGKSPEEAGREMGMKSDRVAQIIFQAALAELLMLIKKEPSHKDKSITNANLERTLRCLERMKDPRQREFLIKVFNHSSSVEEAGEAIGINPEDVFQFMEDALKELHASLLDDWRDSWRRPII